MKVYEQTGQGPTARRRLVGEHPGKPDLLWLRVRDVEVDDVLDMRQTLVDGEQVWIVYISDRRRTDGNSDQAQGA